MHLEVSLAGYLSSWSFRDSRRFSAWAEATPWGKEGGLCVLRTENSVIEEFILPAVTRLVHGINAGERRLDVRIIECGGAHGTPIQALLHDLEFHPSTNAFEARERIRTFLLDRCLILIFTPSGRVQPNEWEDLINLLEHYRKTLSPLGLCAIILDSQGLINTEPIFDYRSGRASHIIFPEGSTAASANTLWPPYLHHRIAWETGGNLGHSLLLTQKLDDVPVGDDEELERRLQRHAIQRLESHSEIKKLYELLEINKSNALGEPIKQRLRDELFAEYLFWRPPAMNSLHPVPWVSRALLAQPSLPSLHKWNLRHQLVCAPLAAEILSLCLKFESQVQTRLHGRQDRAKISEITIENHKRFKDGEDNFVVYPGAFPAPPERDEDIWAFASLGENLKSCPPAAVSDVYWNALRLRNAIAHGHYVNWCHVNSSHRMITSFDRP